MMNILRQTLAFLIFFSTQLWSNSPVNISTPGQDASNQQIAVDPNGNVVAVWMENGLVKTNSATISGGWSSTIYTLSVSGASDPKVQIDPNGKATAIWDENGVIKASSCPLNGTWSDSVAISGSLASSPELAVDSSGNFVAVWSEDGFIKSATMLVGGSWSITPDTISSAGASFPDVAIGSNGTVVAVWQGIISSTPTVYSASKLISGNWGAAVAISLGSVNSVYPQIAVDANGNAIAAWFTYSLTGSVYSGVIVQASSLYSGGSWTTPVNISSSGVRNPADLALSVIAGPNLNGIAAWTTSYDGAFFNCESSVLSSGKWSVPAALLVQNLTAYDCFLAVESFGDAYLIFMKYEDETSSITIQGALNDLATISKTYNNPSTLSRSGNNAYPVAALNSSSNTFFIVCSWVNFNGLNNVIQVLVSGYSIIQPPSNLSVTSAVNDFGVLSEIYNTLSWEASPSQNVVYYLVYRDGQYISWVDSDTLQYIDPNRTTGQTVTYGIAAFDRHGCQSSTVTIDFTN